MVIFCDYLARRIAQVIDPETSVSDLRIDSSWNDAGNNRHAAVRAHGRRHDEHGELGADIVWLIRSHNFRGGFWSRIRKRTDFDYYSQARDAFYRRDYPEFLRLAGYITAEYSNRHPFQKMLAIAERHTTQQRTRR
jgi:hypothetical protein